MAYFRQLELGPMANYVYLVGDPESRRCAVVDPGWEPAAILAAVEKEGCALSAIIATHNHFDHVGAIGELLKAADVPVYVHHDDAAPLKAVAGANLKPVSGGERISIGGMEVSFLHTPGHTAGSQCLKVEDRLLTGDTLFIDGCGRVDLPTSDPEEMAKSLGKIAALPARIVVWPGHDYGPAASAPISEQLKTNAYLAAARKSLSEFLRLVGS